MMTMATPLSAVRTTLELSCLSCVRALCCMGLRLHLLLHCVCGYLSSLLTSDLNSLAFWCRSLEDACSTAVVYASMGVLGGNGKIGSFL